MTDPYREKRPSRIGPKVATDRNLPFHESLVQMLWHAVEARSDHTAVIYQGRSITYREFGRASNGMTALLESLGLEPGPIVIMTPNSIEMDVALMAVMSLGVRAVRQPWSRGPSRRKDRNGCRSPTRWRSATPARKGRKD